MKPNLEKPDNRGSRNDALSRQSIGLAALALGVAMVLVFGDVMIAGNSKVLSKAGCDGYLGVLGRTEVNFGELAQGTFPLWCPSLFCGFPSFGGMQQQLAYPLSLPFLFLTAAEGINWNFILHTFLGGMFMYLWLARQSLNRYACFAGAVMFAFSAPFYLRIYGGHLAACGTIAWIPLVFLAIEGIIATPTLGWFLLGTAAVSLQLLAGHPPFLFYTAIAAALYTLARLHESPKLWKSLLLLALMNVFVLGLTCVQWAAAKASTDECVRNGGMSYEFAASYSLPPENWLTLIRPGIFGDNEKVLYWGRWNIWETCLFFGDIGLFFSAVGLFNAKRRLMLTVAGIALVLGVLAMGGYSPHFRFFYDHVPGFNLLRSNARFGLFSTTFLIFLSAHGLDMLFRDVRKKLSAGMFFGALTACVVVAAMYGVVKSCSADEFKARFMDASLNSGVTSLFNPQKIFGSPASKTAAADFTAGELGMAFCFLAGLAVVLGLNWRRPQWRKWLAPLVIGMISLESLLFAWSMRASFPPELASAMLFKCSIRQQLPNGQVASQAIPDLKTFLKRNLGDGRTFTPDGSSLTLFMDGVSDLWGYGSDNVIRRYAEFIAYTQGENPDQVTGYQRFTTVHRRFDMLRCKCALLTQPDGSLVVIATPGIAPLPKFVLVNDWRVEARRDVVFSAVCSETFNPRQTVILERHPLGRSGPDKSASTEPAGTIRILDENANWEEVEVKLTKAAILLETDLYTPNWRVYALPGSSQTEYELIPANYILRGIPLEAGTHRLRIEYRPTAFVVGKWVSLASLAAFLGLTVFWGVRRRRQSGQKGQEPVREPQAAGNRPNRERKSS